MLVKNNDQMRTILRVLVGSQAHGLATAQSDRDYLRVYVMPTERMFHLGFKYPATQWTKTEGDETAWEIWQFLTLATQCHPLVLETLLAPVVTADQWGHQLRSLFPAIWSPDQAFEAFSNYARNQRTKFLDKKDTLSKKELGVVRIHILSLKAVFRQKLKGSQGKLAGTIRELLIALRAKVDPNFQ